MKDYYDVIVIGSGPSGSTAAYMLGQNDVDTLLIEKEELPRHKTCGGGLTNKTIRLLDRVFDRTPDELSKKNILNFNTVDCRVGFLDNNLDSFEINDNVYFTDRQEYDYFLFQEAENQGIDTLIGDGVDQINFGEDILTTESGQTIEYGELMAADGAHSPTRKSLISSDDISCSYWSDQLAIALEAYVPRDEAPSDFSDSEWLDLHLGVVDWGYGWVFPHKEELLVGVGGLQTENDDIRSALLEYGELLGIPLEDTKIKGHPIPFGNYVKKPHSDNVLLLGDAGGFVDPLTGEGIFYAQRTGELAANAYLHENGERTGDRYQTLIDNHVLPEMTGAWRVRPMVYGGPEPWRNSFFSFGINIFNPQGVVNVAHGHRVWHNFSWSGQEMHDTIKA